ncbi:DUF6597 domain-containing transcriptional factor [Ramlibacter sp. WS9]|uniref:DUF6597 domain-containing transcriptional factor n=1 Tax=Ramlibacter sp. WS9 TaxID=1882741 RepID=UPI0011441F28|nr:DUF6597 domain-containing transcriptional factor [Ramlibacter sp. WS9]ROZ77056.1 helix-turn-helix domain-containing protein [Ramlibacter sp. WS9]
MPPADQTLAATARVVAPPTPLASCVRAFVIRDTTGRLPLPANQRLNHFPASAMCSVSWILEGKVQVPDGAAAFPPVALGGPRTRPRVSYNPGPVHVFIVLFFPQALHALTGLDMSQYTDRFVALETVAASPWQALSRQVMEAPGDEARVELLSNFLGPRWQAARAAGAAPGSRLGDWVNSLAMHVAASGWGRSARNVERRIKVWAGQPLRGLRRFHRAERSFLETRASMEAGTVSWAEAAAEGGFADQAHLCREVRAVTGMTPTELARRIRDDESYWVYRIWS